MILQASQSDELSVVEGEELQVIEEGDVEDWLKVKAVHKCHDIYNNVSVTKCTESLSRCITRLSRETVCLSSSASPV